MKRYVIVSSAAQAAPSPLRAIAAKMVVPLAVGYLGSIGVNTSGVDLTRLTDAVAAGDISGAAFVVGEGVSTVSHQVATTAIGDGVTVAKAFLEGAGLHEVAVRLPGGGTTYQSPYQGQPSGPVQPGAVGR